MSKDGLDFIFSCMCHDRRGMGRYLSGVSFLLALFYAVKFAIKFNNMFSKGTGL